MNNIRALDEYGKKVENARALIASAKNEDELLKICLEDKENFIVRFVKKPSVSFVEKYLSKNLGKPGQAGNIRFFATSSRPIYGLSEELQLKIVQHDPFIIDCLGDLKLSVLSYIIKSAPFKREIHSIWPKVVENFENLSEEDRYILARNYYTRVPLDKCSDKIKKIVISNMPQRFKEIKNPSRDLQEFAFEEDPLLLPYLTIELSENMILKGLKDKPEIFQYIKNPSEAMCFTALYFSPSSIKFMENPSDNLKNLAVSREPETIKYINNPSEELVFFAVSRAPEVIKYIKNPSEELQLEAVRRNPNVINLISHPSKKIQKFAFDVYKKRKYSGDVSKFVSVSPFDDKNQDISFILKKEASVYNKLMKVKVALENNFIRRIKSSDLSK